MAAIKSKYKRFNGVAWEEYYFETSADQVIGLVNFIKDNETKLSTNDSTATSGKYISRIQVSDHGLTITKEDLPTGFSGDYNDLINKPETPLGTVTSVAMTVPTGLSISGSPITSSGTLALSLTNGYSIPTTLKQTNWDTAFGWGDHKTEGYVKTDTLDYPTTFTWNGGTSGGPTGSLTGVNMAAVSFAAIPSASNTASGVVTTGTQTFKGNKSFSDNVVISGDLTVQGENFIANTTTLTTEDDVIELRSSGTTAITTPAGIVIKNYDGTNDGGIVIKNDGEVRVGKVEMGVNGAITNSADAQPVLTRDERSNLTTNRILMWSGSNKATNLDVGSEGQFLNHLHQWATPAAYSHPTHPGDDFSVDTGALTGATVVSRVDINVTTDTLGHVTDANGLVTTRTLTLADLGYVAPTINNGQLSLTTSGVGLSGSGTFTANQSGNTTFTVTSNATDQPTASTIVARDSSGDVRAASKFYYSSNAYTTYNSTDKSIDFVFTN